MSHKAEIGIDWRIPEKDIVLSEKDSRRPLLKDAEIFDINDLLY